MLDCKVGSYYFGHLVTHRGLRNVRHLLGEIVGPYGLFWRCQLTVYVPAGRETEWVET